MSKKDVPANVVGTTLFCDSTGPGSISEEDSDAPTWTDYDFDEDSLHFLDEIVDPDKGEGEICELHTYDSLVDPRGQRVLLKSGSNSTIEVEKNVNNNTALVLTRLFTPLKQLQTTSLHITLLTLKRHCAKWYKHILGSTSIPPAI